jgi:hypothetical protein
MSNDDTLLMYMIEQLDEAAPEVEEVDFSATGRVKMHLEAIEAVRKDLVAASEAGELIQVRQLRENLMTLEASLVGEAARLADLVKAA